MSIPLRLRRAVLCGVGPPDARFDPFELDLRHHSGGAATRALVSLTNTGGKSEVTPGNGVDNRSLFGN